MPTTIAKQLTRLYIESDMQSAESLDLVGGHVISLCRRRPGKTDPNDDSAGVVQTSCGAIVLIVADGVGGSAGGYKASAIAVESIAKSVSSAEPKADLRRWILDGIEQANVQILDLGIGAATTLAVVEIRERTARAYQVGDSTTLIFGQRGLVKWKSTSHSPVGYAVESGMLDENDALHHHDLHLVSNVVGCRSMHIDIGPAGPLATHDTVLVASDGLSDNLHLEEIIAYGRIGKPEKRMEKLSELATERMLVEDETQPGKPDDLTILLFTH